MEVANMAQDKTFDKPQFLIPNLGLHCLHCLINEVKDMECTMCIKCLRETVTLSPVFHHALQHLSAG